MAFYDKGDMVYKDYTWNASPGDNPFITGKPDRDKLSKKEGYEVLDFINHMANVHGFKNKVTGAKIEKMLRHKDIANIHSRAKIQEWMETNWKDN